MTFSGTPRVRKPVEYFIPGESNHVHASSRSRVIE